MKLTIAVLLFCCCFTLPAFTQISYTVKGLVIDTTTNDQLHDATVSVLDAKDSILQTFTYTNKGVFNVSNLKPGKFLLLVTYPDYADYSGHFSLDEAHPLYDFGSIRMILKSTLLNEVLIKAKVAAIKIKGDTTEFNAASYFTQKNAKVEDLLKQLPGMRINQSGAIIFQGESVGKILVDGEEFFSDDPAMVTKNVRADMVNKVQVYNQKSEKAKLTGIEDGVKVRTINIVLREDKRKGLFGKAEAGLGNDDHYMGRAVVNKFSPKQKMAAYGSIGNIGNTGLSGDDRGKYATGNAPIYYGGMGLPSSRDAGVHYDAKWNNDKQSVNTDYSMGMLAVDNMSNTLRQNNLPGNFNTSNRNSTARNKFNNRMLVVNFNSKIDSTADLSAKVSGSDGHSSYDSQSNTTTLRGNGTSLNDSKINSTSNNNYENASASVNYVKRFKKKGRSISLNARTSLNQSDTKGYLRSDLNYYNDQGATDSTNKIDQYKPVAYRSNNISGGFSYTDQLAKSVSLTASYNFLKDASNNERLSYNHSSVALYGQLDSAFSNKFKYSNQSSTYGISSAYSGNKMNVNINMNVADERLKQTEQFQSTLLERNFVNLQPGANFSYQLSKAASLSLNYSGNTVQPSAYQLQPPQQNTDPLNIYLGNLNLGREFNNRLSYNYRVYQPTKDQGINFSGSYTTTSNAIVSNRVTDSSGVNTYQYSNLSGKRPDNWDVYAEVYGHVTKLDFLASVVLSISGNKSFNYINKQLNTYRFTKYSPRVSVWTGKPRYSFNIGMGPDYVLNSTSLQTVNNNSRGYSADLSNYVRLPGNFFMGSDLTYRYTAKNQVFDKGFQQTLLNAYIGKLFLKNEGLKVTIKGNDLLDQNTGYSRSNPDGNFIESRYAVIKRFFMFSLSWDFAKFGKSLQPQE
jgi:hypothetical protein